MTTASKKKKPARAARLASGGRPRAPAVDAAVLKAALHQMAALGYQRLSLDSVAREARVSKTAIYRRWSSKADVAIAALATRIDAEPVPINESFCRANLIALLEANRDALLEPNNMALVGTLLAEEKQTPELIRLFREHIYKRRREMLRRVLERARAEGLLRPGLDLDCVVDMLMGPLYASYLRLATIPPALPQMIVAAVLDGIQVAAPAAARTVTPRLRRTSRG
jgi:AcrR family transcriptional regulator